MATLLTTNGKKKISTFKKEFSLKFNYLTIQFLDKKRKEYDNELNLVSIRTKKGEDISISGQNKINSLESKFEKNLGIGIEVCYSKAGKLVRTKSNNDKTLSELNKWCESNSCDQISKRKQLDSKTASKNDESIDLDELSYDDADELIKQLEAELGVDSSEEKEPSDNKKVKKERKEEEDLDLEAIIKEFQEKPVEESEEEEKESTNIEKDNEENINGVISENLNKVGLNEFLNLLKAKKNKKKFIQVLLYTNKKSTLTYWLKYEVSGSEIEITRENWSYDSYWGASISKNELLEGLINFSENADFEEFFNCYIAPVNVLEYAFRNVGEQNNGFEYEITSINPSLESIPSKLKDSDGELDTVNLMNWYTPISEDLSEQEIGDAIYFEFILEDNIFRLQSKI